MTMNDAERWVKLKNGKRGHRRCLDNYNDTIQCGLEHGDCGNPECCFSDKYRPPVQTEEAK